MDHLGVFSSTRLMPAVAGAVQGTVYWLVYEYWPESSEARPAVLGLVVLITVFALAIQFVWSGSDHKRFLWVVTPIAVVFALCTVWIQRQIPSEDASYFGDELRMMTWLVAAPMALYVIAPYVQIYQSTGRFRFAYDRLFFHSWCNAFIALTGVLYAVIFWAIILLWARLFVAVGIDLFHQIFTSAPFVWIATMLLIAIGVTSGRDNERTIETARRAVLEVFRFLVPLLAAVVLLFAGTLVLVGLEPLWGTGYASYLLLSLIVLAVLFVNAVVEDAGSDPPISRWVRRLVDSSVIVLPVLAGLTIYSLGVRIAQYGLSPERFLGAIVAGIMTLYSTGYAIAVLRRSGPWMRGIRGTNVALSAVLIATALLVHSPILDPLAWSARHQCARLVSGQADPESFDYAFLRFRLGHRGAKALSELEEIEGHPQVSSIRAGIRSAREAQYYAPEERDRVRVTAEHLVPVPGLESVPEGLVDHLNASSAHRARRAECVRQPCEVFAIDLDGDSAPEHCVAFSFSIECHGFRNGGWQWVGFLAPMLRDRGGWDDVHRDLRAGGAAPVPPRWADVQIGDRVYRFQPDLTDE